MVWILRLIFIALILYLFLRFFLHSSAKLALARKRKTFYLTDDPKNVHRNILLTFKGGVFEGEKYLGTNERASEVVTISLWSHEKTELTHEEISFIEQKINERYPSAVIDWKRTGMY